MCAKQVGECLFSFLVLFGAGGSENAGVENARVKNAGVDSRGGKCRSGKYRSDNVWKAVKQKIKILTFLIKSRSTGRPLESSTTKLTGLVAGVGVLLFEADSESDSRLRARTWTLGDSDSTPLNVWTQGLRSLCSSH